MAGTTPRPARPETAYNACRNRHCLECRASAARRWLDARQADLLPGLSRRSSPMLSYPPDWRAVRGHVPRRRALGGVCAGAPSTRDYACSSAMHG